MTATAARPRTAPAGRPPRRPAAPAVLPLSARRTLLALLASVLGVIPLKSLFSDVGWLVDAWLTMVIVIGPAVLLRLRRSPGALDIWPGLILLVPWLTLRFVPQHAYLSCIPSRQTWSDVSLLLTDLHHTTRTGIAPIHTTVAVRLVVCALVGLLAALVDLIAVVGRRGALAGVPLLVVYTVAGAVPRQPVSWVWFTFAALGYLLLLGLDAGEDLQSWGRRISPRTRRRKSALQVSTPRIAAAAIVIAVVVPLLVPGQSRNLIANAFHDNGTGVGGFGAGSNGSISPFAALKGELDRSKPVTLAKVHVLGSRKVIPYNLRVNVLEKYTGAGWAVGDHGTTQDVDSTVYPTYPNSGGSTGTTQEQQVVITPSGVSGNVPVFAVPTSITGLDDGTTWSPKDQVLLGASVRSGEQYSELFRQPAPTVSELNNATSPAGPDLASLLELPSNFPSYAHDLVTTITRGAQTPYQQALALNNYFTDGKNGFVYDLKTQPGDSGSDLVDFLKNKQGYCQQYAAALGVMLRDAGIPSRIVLGYMHDAPNAQGNFTITTSEAHAWVEAYFSGVGWVPFDPTPAAGLAGGAASDLPWAPHNYPKTGSTDNGGVNGNADKTVGPSTAKTSPVVQAPDQQTPSQAVGTSSGGQPSWWWVLGALVLLLPFLPAAARSRRRRQHYLAGRRDGDPDALWAELSDTAVDLGYVWSPARSPRQVVAWLSRDARDSQPSLQALATAVERDRYSPGARAEDPAGLTASLREVTGELRSGRSRATRIRAALWPASLGWGARITWLLGRRTPLG